MWKFEKKILSDNEVVFKTDGYAVCPVCLSNDYTDHIGDEFDFDISHWKCTNDRKHNPILFSVYDKHEDYKQTFREDHFDFYYILDDWEFDGLPF